MKSALFFLLLSINLSLAQNQFSTKKGLVVFEASIPGFEEVKAKSNDAICKLNIENGIIESTVFIKTLHFKLELMEEHFNDNYLESKRYPKSIFKGKILDFNEGKITETEKEFIVKGTLELHGKTQNISVVAFIKKQGKKIFFRTKFFINVDDYDVKIPNLVSNKVSNKVEVTAEYTLN